MGETPDETKQLELAPASLLILVTIVVTILMFAKLGLYKAMLRYMTLHVMSKIFIGAIGSAIVVSAVVYLIDGFMPRSIPIIYASLLIALTGRVPACYFRSVSQVFGVKFQKIG
jgi:FlaA1/EpsC-like NDP-sugar epimerase